VGSPHGKRAEMQGESSGGQPSLNAANFAGPSGRSFHDTVLSVREAIDNAIAFRVPAYYEIKRPSKYHFA